MTRSVTLTVLLVTQRQKAVTAAVAEIPGQVHDFTLESRFVLTVVKHVLWSSAP